MDLFSTKILIFYFIICVILLVYNYVKTYNRWSKMGVKGPMPVPFLGTLVHFLFKTRAELEIKWYNTYGKIYGLYYGNRPLLQIGDPELVKNILVKDFKVFAHRVKPPNVHPVADNDLGGIPYEQWKRVRYIMSPAFAMGGKKMYPIYRQCSNRLLKALELKGTDEQEVDMKIMYGKYALDVKTSSLTMNIDLYDERSETFVRQLGNIMIQNISDYILNMIIPESVLRYFKVPHLVGIVGRKGVPDYFESILGSVLNERKENNIINDDFIGLILKYEKTVEQIKNNEINIPDHVIELNKYPESQRYLTRYEIISNCLRYIYTGSENIRNTLTFCTHELALNPEVQEKLYLEIMSSVDSNGEIDYDLVLKLPYLDAVIDETLRMHPTQHNLRRMADCTYKLGDTGITLFKGQHVEIPMYAMHYCEEYFENAKQFIPERFLPENRHKILPYTYLPFGDGPRNCIAVKLSYVDIKIALVHLMKCYQYVVSKNTDIPVQMENTHLLNIPKRGIIKLLKRN